MNGTDIRHPILILRASPYDCVPHRSRSSASSQIRARAPGELIARLQRVRAARNQRAYRCDGETRRHSDDAKRPRRLSAPSSCTASIPLVVVARATAAETVNRGYVATRALRWCSTLTSASATMPRPSPASRVVERASPCRGSDGFAPACNTRRNRYMGSMELKGRPSTESTCTSPA
jgi:hypothetical protein